MSQWANVANAVPTALVPFASNAAYSVSVGGIVSLNAPGGHIAVGLTSSGATANNFASSAQAWLGVRRVSLDWPGNMQLICELRLNGRAGALLATGQIIDSGETSENPFNILRA
jgi:hypothetical protein